MKKYLLFACILPLLGALALTSCSKKNVKGAGDNAEMVTDTATLPTLDIEEGEEGATVEGDIRRGEFVSQDILKTITFDFDRYELSDKSREALQENAELLKARKEWSVVVEGHCDDRGTIEYNLALGQKRAKSVRDYYVRLGVPESSIGTISYGEEKPVCFEASEPCWLQNRRAETKVRTN